MHYLTNGQIFLVIDFNALIFCFTFDIWELQTDYLE